MSNTYNEKQKYYVIVTNFLDKGVKRFWCNESVGFLESSNKEEIIAKIQSTKPDREYLVAYQANKTSAYFLWSLEDWTFYEKLIDLYYGNIPFWLYKKNGGWTYYSPEIHFLDVYSFVKLSDVVPNKLRPNWERLLNTTMAMWLHSQLL